MKAQSRQYIFGLIFIAFGAYQLYLPSYLEFSLYASAGAAFICNALVSEPRLHAHKKILVIITWMLIVAAAVLFFYLIRYKYF
jgi:hypothetical protein